MAESTGIRVDVFHHLEFAMPQLDAIEQKLDQIISATTTIQEQEVLQMADLSAITASVANIDTVEDSAVALLGSLSEQIRALATDPEALAALADQLDASSSELAEAVAANTPAAS